MRKSLPLLLALAALLCMAARAEEVINPGTVRGTAMKSGIPVYVADFTGGGASVCSEVVRKDLNLHGGFSLARISARDAQTLNHADYRQGSIHFQNWRNLGCSLIGKGELVGGTLSFRMYNTATGAQVMGRTYTVGSVSQRRLGHAVACDIVKDILKLDGFFNSRILYASGQGTGKNIVLCDILGGDRRQITQGGELNTFPDWYPDHKNILYTSYRDRRAVLYSLDLTTGKTTKLLAQPGMNTCGSISPDGKQLAAILDKDGFPELYTYALSGGTHKRLTRGRENESSPCWSPDSQKLAFACDEGRAPQIYIMNAVGGGKQRICRNVSRYCTSPDWSPDGKKIAYVAQIGANYEICVCDLATGSSVNVTNNPSNDEFPNWCADSRHIVFARSSSMIMIVDTETGKETALVSDGRALTAPALEP